MNHGKRRRLAKVRVGGATGTPHPAGNREMRRSREGRVQMERTLEKIAQELAMTVRESGK